MKVKKIISLKLKELNLLMKNRLEVYYGYLLPMDLALWTLHTSREVKKDYGKDIYKLLEAKVYSKYRSNGFLTAGRWYYFNILQFKVGDIYTIVLRGDELTQMTKDENGLLFVDVMKDDTIFKFNSKTKELKVYWEFCGDLNDITDNKFEVISVDDNLVTAKLMAFTCTARNRDHLVQFQDMDPLTANALYCK
jgi:hypothetical protein